MTPHQPDAEDCASSSDLSMTLTRVSGYAYLILRLFFNNPPWRDTLTPPGRRPPTHPHPTCGFSLHFSLVIFHHLQFFHLCFSSSFWFLSVTRVLLSPSGDLALIGPGLLLVWRNRWMGGLIGECLLSDFYKIIGKWEMEHHKNKMACWFLIN